MEITEHTVNEILRDVCELEPDLVDCAKDNPEGGLCVSYETLNIILRRHLLGEE